ncbi:ubiquitin-specific protease UBP6 NDAI_0H03550 [Naumovozyma dairenensis CBS 421]|uniref:Ubiquitin carboxyl-terminal hydrolase n=1 Tax=Naumovozyma dairenensis (strain ATCC 10597 / BCRC 20456 / CBS 421 / NBRC 0211 / NRRL Y-12639) TaxID=1071378 RepID=G0WFG7_NAUDC|nr:hypothetical protein NDAI_0H03550 [Naumovozyma dairenensis CBS 421]CCD26528.1 hypothetical protein NDAI_0H03550 [Naumovozyma dairenensis CBS 421]
MSAIETLDFNIKHQGKLYPISIPSKTTTALELKTQAEELTQVPISRQKYMVKGGLSNDSMTDLDSVIKPNSTIMMLGTPDANLITKPKSQNHFIEDLSPDQQLQKMDSTPIGFQNMGNTCYMNATLQALYRTDDIRQMILDYKPPAQSSTYNPEDEMHHKIVLEIKRCFENLEKKNFKSVMPMMLLTVLRKCYPQFAERDPRGGFYKQQDAEELFTQLFHTFSIVFGDKFSNDFTILFKTTIKDTNNEDDVQIKTDENDLKLQCHISSSTNFMKNGLIESMHESIEKRSEITGVNSTYSVDKQITKLPKFLTVQYVRFYWKRSTGKKSKILRKVVFPFQLDLSDMLTPEYQQEKIKVRDAMRQVEKNKLEKERELKKRKLSPTARSTNELMTPREEAETEKAIEESEKEYWLNEYAKCFPKDLRQGENPSCVYNLIGIITHQGANSESGHYQAFMRDENDENKWYKFNDDKVTVVEKEKIEALAGGGESDSALILMYKGLGL